ncbi:4-O-methyl-glucuronoyl methylesterase 1-like [Diaphorina citri]|uniref:4-O-methyl-glucuronoyl methylesterase 1-like n=1 Tax=Diaphorina citri TaxID=121845 RepID=A0A3Q0JH63_DIACI|nr:4-O-methyl-glucuronoyl methylesterase 1-like [Diaphorina citri]
MTVPAPTTTPAPAPTPVVTSSPPPSEPPSPPVPTSPPSPSPAAPLPPPATSQTDVRVPPRICRSRKPCRGITYARHTMRKNNASPGHHAPSQIP